MSVNDKIFDNLSGKVLIATPYMLDGIFNKSLNLYAVSYSRRSNGFNF